MHLPTFGIRQVILETRLGYFVVGKPQRPEGASISGVRGARHGGISGHQKLLRYSLHSNSKRREGTGWILHTANLSRTETGRKAD